MEVDTKLFEYLDSKYGKDNWKIRKVSKDKNGQPSLTISSADLKKIGLKSGDKVLIVVSDGVIHIYRL